MLTSLYSESLTEIVFIGIIYVTKWSKNILTSSGIPIRMSIQYYLYIMKV